MKLLFALPFQIKIIQISWN